MAVTLLVTGAGGFVGAGVVREALAQGLAVVATGRSEAPERLAGLGVRYARVDLDDHAAMAAMVAAARPDVVIHTAWTGVSGSARDQDNQFANVETTWRLADAAVSAGARKFVGIGSQAEYGRRDRPLVETDVPVPTTLYGVAKLAASHFARLRCLQAGIGFAWLRLFATYGPGDNGNWLIPTLAATMLRGGRPRLTPGTQKWDYLHNDDTARGIIATVLTDTQGVYNLSSGTAVPVRDIAERIRDVAAPGLDLVFGEVPFGRAQIMHLEGDIAALTAATGWTPRITLDDGLAQVVAALR